MKNKSAVVLMAVAVLFGLAAVVLAWVWKGSQTGTSGRIVVASADINLGERLTPAMLKLVSWPAGSTPKGAFTDPEKLAGRVLRSSVMQGDPLNEGKLAPTGTLGGLSAVIAEGKRAITVRVNDVVGVAGFALPGNYVDIIVSMQKDLAPNAAMRQESISKIVLERILVLAVAQEVNRDETKPKVVNAVTLEVTPDQAEKLDLARSVGTLSLALRNQVDPESANTDGATKLTLLPDTAPRKAPQAAPPRPAPAKVKVAAPVMRDCVRVINGLQASQECF